MDKVYIIQWGYNSSNDGGQELDSIWSTKEKAKKCFDKISKQKKCNFIKTENYASDGDYWVSITEINLDNEDMFA